MARTADPFGVLTPVQGATTSLGRSRDVPGLVDPTVVRTRTPDVFPGEVVTPPPAVVTPQVGSPLNTLYGVDSESFLTDDQRKLARMIQGKFDASMNRRDRELSRYGAPMLSSFAEDESLARAMAAARGLNFRPDAVPDTPTGFPRPGSSIPRSVAARTLTPPTPTTPNKTGAQNNAQWQRILTGLASLVPLLFGKDAFGNFLNKGALQWGKELLFGKDAPAISDQAFEQLVRSGNLPSDGAITYNPITGQPMAATPGAGFTNPYGNIDQGYGFGNTPGIAGGTLQDYWNDPGMWDSGYWYPDLGGSLFDNLDPYGIGGW